MLPLAMTIASSKETTKMPKADTSWITDEMLDALAMTESDMDPTAYNENSGAAGMYQWMPEFYEKGAEIGFGVDLGPFDPYDPVESRKRAKQYLTGIQEYYPDWDPTEVLMAYNWGPGNVNRFKTQEDFTEKYMAKSNWNKQKVEEAMNYPKKILRDYNEMYADLNSTGFESTIE